MKACIIVDYQYDFLDSIHGGALAVKGGWDILDAVKQEAFAADWVIATRDWHPWNHVSFKAQGGPWEPHCVQGTSGAVIAHGVDNLAEVIISKGMANQSDSYSAASNLAFLPLLRDRLLPSDEIRVCGLAFDYCVGHTALSIRAGGFKNVKVPYDATVGIGAESTQSMLNKLYRNGVKVGDNARV